VFPVFASVKWLTGASCPELPSQAGRFQAVPTFSNVSNQL